jgi:hypothetical protein
MQWRSSRFISILFRACGKSHVLWACNRNGKLHPDRRSPPPPPASCAVIPLRVLSVCRRCRWCVVTKVIKIRTTNVSLGMDYFVSRFVKWRQGFWIKLGDFNDIKVPSSPPTKSLLRKVINFVLIVCFCMPFTCLNLLSHGTVIRAALRVERKLLVVWFETSAGPWRLDEYTVPKHW